MDWQTHPMYIVMIVNVCQQQWVTWRPMATCTQDFRGKPHAYRRPEDVTISCLKMHGNHACPLALALYNSTLHSCLRLAHNIIGTLQLLQITQYKSHYKSHGWYVQVAKQQPNLKWGMHATTILVCTSWLCNLVSCSEGSVPIVQMQAP